MSKYELDSDYLDPDSDISNKEINEIIDKADKIINSGKPDPDILFKACFKKARCLQIMGKFEESKESIEIALKIYPEMPKALVLLGNVLNHVENKYDAAIECINKALEQLPEYAFGFVMRGNVYLKKGELDKAVSDYSYAITLQPDYVEAYINRGGVYFLLGKHDDVITDCNEAIRLDPNYANAYVNRGNAYLNKDEFDKAIADYNKAAQIDPNHLLSFFNCGVAYANRGEIDKAITNFVRAIQLQPDIVYAINDRCIVYGKEGEFDKAIEIFSFIIQQRPDYYDAVNNRGIVFAQMRNYEKAIADFTRAIQLVPNNAAPYFNLGNLYDETGVYDKAILNFSIGLRIQPTDTQAFFKRANIYTKLHDYNKALADYTKVIQFKPDCAEAFYNRGIIYGCIKEYNRAIADFNDALHNGLEDADVFLSRGDAFFYKRDYDSAIADYERTLQLKPDNIDAFFNIGNIYWGKKEYDKAIEIYNKAILLQPNHFGSFFNRGALYEIKGEKDKALYDYRKALLLIIESKETSIDSLYSKNIEDFYYLADKVLPYSELFWELPIDKLQNIPHFFIEIILKFRNMEMEKSSYKKLIQSVYSLWQKCREFNNGVMVYQYTSMKLLEKIRSDRRLHLEPAIYQNDPEEGKIFYKQLVKYFKSKNSYIADIIESLSKTNSETVVFIRSLTSCKDSLVMWNSSYGDNGHGISIGIPVWKINKGQGIDKSLTNYTPPIRLIDYTSTMRLTNSEQNNELSSDQKTEKRIEINSSGITGNEQIDGVVPLWKMGLYKIMYLSEADAQEKLKNIIDCLLQIEEKEYTEELKKLLGELFSSVTHIIKDKSYAHEEEYRLLFVDTLNENKKYIRKSVINNICEGIYVETEPILFVDDKDKVYFGPKIPEVTIDKYRHSFSLSGLPLSGSIYNMLIPSEIKYR